MFAFIHRSYLGGSEGTTDTDEKKHHRGGMDRAQGTVHRGGGDGNRMVEGRGGGAMGERGTEGTRGWREEKTASKPSRFETFAARFP